MKIVDENEVIMLQENEEAETSPLVECSGIFIYNNESGFLAHYKDARVEPQIDQIIKGYISLKSVIAGCCILYECTIYDSDVYRNMKNYLQSRNIATINEHVGNHFPVVFAVNMTKRRVQIRMATDKEIEQYS